MEVIIWVMLAGTSICQVLLPCSTCCVSSLSSSEIASKQHPISMFLCALMMLVTFTAVALIFTTLLLTEGRQSMQVICHRCYLNRLTHVHYRSYLFSRFACEGLNYQVLQINANNMRSKSNRFLKSKVS